MSGLRARCKGRPDLGPGDGITLVIESDTQCIRVAGRAVWVRRAGLRTFEVGIQFVDVRPGIAAALAQLAQYGFITADGPAPAGPAQPQTPRPITATVEVEDLYTLFGVPRDADEQVIRDTYHRLARQYHPDVCKDPEGQAKFTDISKAYSVLRDPDRRRRYDAMLDRAGRAA